MALFNFLLRELAGNLGKAFGGKTTYPSREKCWKKQSTAIVHSENLALVEERPLACSSDSIGNSHGLWNNLARENWPPKHRTMQIDFVIPSVDGPRFLSWLTSYIAAFDSRFAWWTVGYSSRGRSLGRPTGIASAVLDPVDFD